MIPFGYIYKTTNLVNGKVYIGKHKRNKRSIDKKYFGSGKILHYAINKYGIENFKNEIICWCFSEKELNKQEIFFIEKYKEYSYNIAAGGDGGNLMKFLSDEEKKKVYNKMIKTRKDKKIGCGESNPMYKSGERGIHPQLGKPHSESTKRKISKTLMGNIPWNKGTRKEPKKIPYEERYLKNKCKIPLKITHIKNSKVEYFESRNHFKKKYPEINVKYGLVKGFYKEMIFESISKKEYLSTLKEGGQFMGRP